MPTSEAQICNKALARLGIKAYIDDLETDQTEEAETCNVFYEPTRDACLAAFAWPFATARLALTEISTEVEPRRDGWAHVFGLPADCLAARSIWPTPAVTDPAYDDLYGPNGRDPLYNSYLRTPQAAQKIPYAIERAADADHQVLLCDLATPVLLYTARVIDPTRFPPLFADALSWLLAAEIALPLTQSDRKEVLCRARYVEHVHAAYAAAMNEQREDQEPDSELITVRY